MRVRRVTPAAPAGKCRVCKGLAYRPLNDPICRDCFAQERRAARDTQDAERKAELGNECGNCRAKTGLRYNFDGPNPVGTRAAADWSQADWVKHKSKVMLLCGTCQRQHVGGDPHEFLFQNTNPHGGGLTGKKNCTCELCITRRKEYVRDQNRKRRSKKAG